MNIHLLTEASNVIGLTELRVVLGFTPSVPWNHRQRQSKEELVSSTNLKDYYELKEPILVLHGPEYEFLLEKHLKPAIAFIDKRFPSIRIIYREFLAESIRTCKGEIDRNAVDFMIEEYYRIYQRVRKAVDEVRFDNNCPSSFIKE